MRPYVERMLGHAGIEIAGPNGTLHAEALNFSIPAPASNVPGAPGMQRQVQIAPSLEERVEFRSLQDRLDELNRKLDQLQKELHEQSGRHPSPAQNEKNIPPAEPEQPAESPK